jgi:hypothetical protein
LQRKVILKRLLEIYLEKLLEVNDDEADDTAVFDEVSKLVTP